MYLRFWGTRGSISKAGPTTLRYGGHTSCVEVRSSAGTIVVLDCGTGGYDLGRSLANAGPQPLHGYVLLTHTHWDHIQGIPFFQPFLKKGNEWDVFAPHGMGQSLREALAGQMQYSYFPVALEQFAANVRYHELVEGTFTIGDIRVTARYLNHTVLTLCYRLEVDGHVIVYSTDHEPHSRQLAMGHGEISGEDSQHAQFVAGADILIHDAQYLASEYPEKISWGHSTMEYVTEIARSAGVKRLALYHHEPLREDDALDRIVESARIRLAEAANSIEVFAAAEGQVIELAPVPVTVDPEPRAAGATAISTSNALLHHSVLVADTDEAFVDTITKAGREGGFKVFTASDGDSVVRFTLSERPSLLILNRHLTGRDGLDVARMLRSEREPYSQEVPIVLVTAKENPDDVAKATAAGVSDWLIRPFSDAYLRTRVRAWLLRMACRWRIAPMPHDEDTRLNALRRTGIMDSAPEERFDRITRLAAALFDVPVSMVSLVEKDRQWFKSSVGTEVKETPREVSFCAHTILERDVLQVPDARLDPRFADNPLVTGPTQVRFYAGAPVSLGDGSRVGALCIVDQRPRQLDPAALQLLRDLAIFVEQELKLTRPS